MNKAGLFTVPVYMSCDDNYAKHLCVVIASIVENTTSKVHFIILSAGLTQSNKDKIVKSAKGHCVDFPVLDEWIEYFSNLQMKQTHISIAACYRYLIPLLNYPYEKGIYLDCDVVVMGDIAKLYDFPIGDNYIAGASDAIRESYFSKWGLDRYFNSGVLLLNIKLLRQDNLSIELFKKTLELQNEIKYLDQDILNIVLRQKMLLLPVKWGVVAPFFRKNVSVRFVSDSEKHEAVYAPEIIHFTGPDKPWIIPYGVLAHPYTPAYFYYLSLTPFANEEGEIKSKYKPISRLFWYLKRHTFFFLRPMFFRMRKLYCQNLRKYNLLRETKK